MVIRQNEGERIMRAKHSLIRLLKTIGIMLILGISIMIIIIDVVVSYRDFNSSANKMRLDYIYSQKEIAKQEVMQVVELIKHKKDQSEAFTKTKIKSRVYEAYAIAKNIHTQNKDSKSKVEIQKMIIDALRPIRFDQWAGYYFIDDMDGVARLNSERQELEGKNLTEVQDKQGKYIFKDILENVEQSNEGFIEYYWQKPGVDEGEYKKISFIKRFEPYDWVIGTGLYFEDVEDQIKQELFSDISRIRFGEEGYVFINEFNGNILVANGELIPDPKRIWDYFYKNAEGMKDYFRKAVKAAAKPEGDFIYYTHYKLKDPEALSPKMSFIYSVPEWDFFVGAGVYLDDIELGITTMETELQNQIKTKVLYFALLVMAIVAFFLFVFSWLSSRLINDFELFTSFFNRAAFQDENINRDKVQFSELDWMAHNANKMLQDKIEVQQDLKSHHEHLEDLVKERTVELEKEKKKAEVANKAKSEFLANMTHELRTPLNAVIGFSELLSSMMKDDKQKSYVQSIKTAGRSLLTLINDVLDLSKIEANMLEIKPNIVNVKGVVGEIEQIFRVKIERKGIEFLVDIDKSIPEALVLDEVRIRQILFNLIGNADKFTEKGFIKVAVNKLLIDEANAIIDFSITVEDSGIGIPEKDIEEIFESFKQHDALDTRRFGGTGLGLAICKKLAMAMGGEISVKSVLGEGSVFEIILQNIPIAASKESVLSLEESLKLENISFEQAKILVVDDIESNREVLQEMLPKVGLSVMAAENGKIALELISETKPDLIFMDIRMPVLDGIQATLKLKANPETENIPVIALTASSSIQDKEITLESGFDGLLTKPYEVSELISILSKFLKHSILERTPLKEHEVVVSSIENVDFKKISDPVKLIKILNSEVVSSYKLLKDTMIIGRVTSLGERIKDISEKHEIFILHQLGVDLITYADSFDTVGIESELDKLADTIEQINGMWSKFNGK